MKSAQKKDSRMRIVIVVVVVFMVVMSIPLVKSVTMAHDYRNFVDTYSKALNYARKNSGVKVEVNGETYTLSSDKASRMFTYIVDAGMGKPIKEMPEGDTYTLKFPDGCSMKVSETVITEKSRLKDEGIAISFTNKEGKIYQYDTDRIDNDGFLKTLRSE